METMSSSVSSFKVPKIHPKIHPFYHLKTPNPSSHLLPHPQISTPTTITVASISAKPTPSSHHNFIPPQLPSTSQSTQTSILTHRNAATGYAAALIDAALCSDSLDAIHKDVKRLSKWLKHNELLKDIMADPSVEEGVKGRVIKELSEKAKFRRQVVALVKMLVSKHKSGMVAQVMEEFERIYYELNNTSRVLV